MILGRCVPCGHKRRCVGGARPERSNANRCVGWPSIRGRPIGNDAGFITPPDAWAARKTVSELGLGHRALTRRDDAGAPQCNHDLDDVTVVEGRLAWSRPSASTSSKVASASPHEVVRVAFDFEERRVAQ